MDADAPRWDGRRGWYEDWYVTIPGRFWLRRSLHVATAAGAPEWAYWLAAFDGEPLARRSAAPPEGDLLRGEVDGARWELELEPQAPPFDVVHPLLRPVAKTKFVLPAPAARATGSVEIDGRVFRLDNAPATRGHVWGTRRAERWGWAHATLPDGRWVELLLAKVAGLPQVAAFAGNGMRRSRLRVGGASTPTTLRVGPYRVEAALADLAGVTYRDPDGSPVYCYHAEGARLHGPGVDAVASFEYGSRRPLADVPLFV